MNKDAQRIAIAKALGLDVKLCPVHHAYECCGRKIPNYLEDLNAMHLAEEWLESNRANLCLSYTIQLKHVIYKNGIVGDWRYIHATTSQRAKAFLEVLGLWVESPQHLEGGKL